jgi:hypothetical protein
MLHNKSNPNARPRPGTSIPEGEPFSVPALPAPGAVRAHAARTSLTKQTQSTASTKRGKVCGIWRLWPKQRCSLARARDPERSRLDGMIRSLSQSQTVPCRISRYAQPLRTDGAGRVIEPIRCLHCGYLLTGLLADAACPECGTSIGCRMDGLADETPARAAGEDPSAKPREWVPVNLAIPSTSDADQYLHRADRAGLGGALTAGPPAAWRLRHLARFGDDEARGVSGLLLTGGMAISGSACRQDTCTTIRPPADPPIRFGGPERGRRVDIRRSDRSNQQDCSMGCVSRQESR